MNELEIYPINRKVWQPLWEYYMSDITGEFDDEGYNNNTFKRVSYDWADDSTQEYNFWHKPSGFKIRWYKYALRGASCNMDITTEQFVDVLIDCLNSVCKDRGYKTVYGCDKWWEN